ncbi:hypothetical protein Golob_004892, partial [Gossypium lobatum]|nr:hypothetical protein [Gossypium lobatum]
TYKDACTIALKGNTVYIPTVRHFIRPSPFQRNRSSGNVQCLSYVSSDDNLSYHVACMKEACRDNFVRGYFRPGILSNERSKFLALKNLAPKVEPSSVGRTSEVLLIRFLKLVVFAILGEPFDLIAPLFQPSRRAS